MPSTRLLYWLFNNEKLVAELHLSEPFQLLLFCVAKRAFHFTEFGAALNQ